MRYSEEEAEWEKKREERRKLLAVAIQADVDERDIGAVLADIITSGNADYKRKLGF